MNSAAYKKRLLYDLLYELVQQNNWEPVRIASESHGLYGVFIPFGVPQSMEPPQLAAEQEEEFRDRMAHLDDSVTAEEIIEMLKTDLRDR